MVQKVAEPELLFHELAEAKLMYLELAEPELLFHYLLCGFICKTI